jgi:DNA-binding CsgD family transcriptional regulator
VSELPTSDTEGGALRAELIIGVGRVALGDSAAVPDVRAALERIADLDDPRSLVMAAVGATGVGDEATRAAVLRRADALARTAGAVDVLSTVLVNVAVTGLITNQFTAAASAEEGLELAREAGLSNAATIHLAVLAWLDALHGREAECLARAAAVADSARVTGLALANTIAEWAIAMLDLSAGRIEETTTRLLALRAAPPGIGHRYFIRGATPDLVEACVRTGRGAEAQAAYGTLEDFAGPDAPLWAQALAARCRALLARDDEETEAAFAETLALYERTSRPYERARTELLYGEQLRRKRRRVEARDHLRTALEAFEGLGAVAWAERARAELRASGETARKRDPSTVSELTPQELQVARFVAEGLSNKEVAAQLFLSPRTIDAHLRNVFAKLGITSRTQLARLQLGFDDVTDAAPTSAVA